MPLSREQLLDLAVDIEQELNRLKLLKQNIKQVQQAIQTDPAHASWFYENLALKLHNFYTGCERIFRLIATELNGSLPSGMDWHRRLLERMAVGDDRRPPVITRETLERLREFLSFRHVVRNLYGHELKSDRIALLVADYETLWPTLQQEFERFVAWIRNTAAQVEGPSL